MVRVEGSLRTRHLWTTLAMIVTSIGGVCVAVVPVVCRLREGERGRRRGRERVSDYSK